MKIARSPQKSSLGEVLSPITKIGEDFQEGMFNPLVDPGLIGLNVLSSMHLE